MRVLSLILLAVGSMAAPQASSEASVTSPSTDSPVAPPSPSVFGETTVAPPSTPVAGETTVAPPSTPVAGETTVAPPSTPVAGEATVESPSAAAEKHPTEGNRTDIAVPDIGNIKVIGVLEDEMMEEVDSIAQGYNRLRNLGVMDLEDEMFDEEGIEAGAATFKILKIKKVLTLAKIALIVMGIQESLDSETSVAMQVQNLMELLNLRDAGVASNALEVVSAAHQQTNVAEQLAFDEEEATRKVAEVLAQVSETAVASLQGAAHGQVLFAQNDGATVVMGTIVGLRPGQHHLSIYERGNCSGPGQRFDHSGIGETSVGTLLADDTGRATIVVRAANVALTGPRGVLGRTVVVAPVAEGRNRSPLVVSATYAAAQFVPSLGEFLAEENNRQEQYTGDFSCGIIVRE